LDAELIDTGLHGFASSPREYSSYTWINCLIRVRGDLLGSIKRECNGGGVRLQPLQNSYESKKAAA